MNHRREKESKQRQNHGQNRAIRGKKIYSKSQLLYRRYNSTILIIILQQPMLMALEKHLKYEFDSPE
jgi:hypothetical protein